MNDWSRRKNSYRKRTKNKSASKIHPGCALIAVYVGITATGFFVLSSSALGMLDDHNANKEVSIARVTGVLLGLFITNTAQNASARATAQSSDERFVSSTKEAAAFFDNGDKGGSRNSIVEHEVTVAKRSWCLKD